MMRTRYSQVNKYQGKIGYIPSSSKVSLDMDNLYAYEACEEFLRRSLITPSVAIINPKNNVSPQEAVYYHDGVYEVYTSVDSQNRFGAMLRKDYQCTAYKDAAGNWRLKDIIENPRR